MADFNTLNSLTDIINAQRAASSDDGETRSLEFKGCNGDLRFGRDVKRLLAKEVCAFANTYGGVLCFHFGGDDQIMPFPNDHCSSEYTRLETWLRDSLQPMAKGMDIKVVDDVFLIDIPESSNKPHRSAPDSHYYFRHGTISQKMPEIMISSMYQSQDYLDFSARTSAIRTSRQLTVDIRINNQSRVAGTKPRLEIKLYSSANLSGLRLQQTPYFNPNGGEPFSVRQQFHVRRLFPFIRLASNLEFSERVLYPSDHIYVSLHSQPLAAIQNVNPLYILTSTDCMFVEGIRSSHFSLLQLSNSRTNQLMEGSERELSMLIERFVQLKNEANRRDGLE